MEIVTIKKFQARNFNYEELILSEDMQKRTEQMNNLSVRYNLHPITVKDCIQRNQRAKIEYYNDYKYLVWHYFHPSFPNPVEIHFILGINYLLLITDTTPTQLVETWKMLCFPGGQNIILNDALYQMFNVFSRHAELYIEALDYEIARLEERIISHSCSPKKILKMKYLVYEVQKNMRSSEIIIERIQDMNELNSDQIIYLRDIKDSFKRMNENIEYLHLASMSLFNIFYGSNSAYSNKIMKRLTLFSIYFLPISATACIFSMNIELLPYEKSWFQILALCVVLGLPLLIFIYFGIHKIFKFKKNKMLIRKERHMIKLHPFMNRKLTANNHFSKNKNRK